MPLALSTPVRPPGSTPPARPSRSRRATRPLLGLLLSTGLAAGLLAAIPAAASAADASFFGAGELPTIAVATDRAGVELGMRFTVASAGTVSAIRFYKGGTANAGPHTVSLWSSGGGLLARVTAGKETAAGWQQVALPTPVPVWPGVTYTASYYAPKGGYSVTYDYFGVTRTRGALTVPRGGGVFLYGGGFPTQTYRYTNYSVDLVYAPSVTGPVASPTPSYTRPGWSPAPVPSTTSPAPVPSSTSPAPVPSSTSPAPVPSTTSPAPVPSTTSPAPVPSTSAPTSGAAMPGASNTGVPAGVVLTAMSGLVVDTPNTVIDAKDVRGQITVAASGVVIRNSRITGTGSYGVYVRSGSVTITDSEITGVENAVAGNNWTAIRVDIYRTYGDGVKAGSNMLLQDSWIHDPTPAPGAHADGIQMQSGVVNMVVRHNTIDMSTADTNSAIFLSPDQGPTTDGPVLVENNYVNGGYYTVFCLDGDYGKYFVRNITIRNNSFGPASAYGPVRVNVPVTWTGNVWAANGRPVTI